MGWDNNLPRVFREWDEITICFGFLGNGIRTCFSPGMSSLGLPGVMHFRASPNAINNVLFPWISWMEIHVLLGATGQGRHEGF